MPSWRIWSLDAGEAHVTVAVPNDGTRRPGAALETFAASEALTGILRGLGSPRPMSDGLGRWHAGDRSRAIGRTIDDHGLMQDLLVVPNLYVLDGDGHVVRASRDEEVPGRA